jgi:hypothetical protein
MKYLKLFEDFETENKYSVSFDMTFLNDVKRGLDRANLKYEEKDNIYFRLKKQTELLVWTKSELDIIRVIPAWVKNLQVYRQK